MMIAAFGGRVTDILPGGRVFLTKQLAISLNKISERFVSARRNGQQLNRITSALAPGTWPLAPLRITSALVPRPSPLVPLRRLLQHNMRIAAAKTKRTHACKARMSCIGQRLELAHHV